MATNAVQLQKTVADPNAAYESMKPLWQRNRAVCNGERFVKEMDSALDVHLFGNMLIPFSPSMSIQQYAFYKAEAELPGIVSQYAKMVIGALLRKKPQLTLPKDAPADAKDWILSEFGEDDSSLSAFLDKALWEELQTSRCWVQVDYPKTPPDLTRAELLEFKPYPIIHNADAIVNWVVAKDASTGTQQLTRVIIRGYEESFEQNEFHANLIDVVFVHELVEGKYQIRKFVAKAPETVVATVNGVKQTNYSNVSPVFECTETVTEILIDGERLTFIPIWPLNGSIEIIEPVLTPLVDKEVSLYNKLSRRNHLLYGAATYTPVISSNMSDEQFSDIVNSGLGTWLHLQQGDTATVLETPTAALQDMDRAIAAGMEEMAKLGVRMMTPETAQSGVALELRNASQTAQLGTLNTKVSNQLADIIAFMLNWRYGTKYTASDIQFSMSADFNPAPLGDMWLRLITEWYQSGLIPRSIWLQILKSNDIVPPEYDDEEGQTEITQDESVITPVDQMNFDFKRQMMEFRKTQASLESET
jgi:hypothetical protein